MIKIFAVGLWVCAVALASSYVVAARGIAAAEVAGNEEPSYFKGLDYRRTGDISVPIIAANQIKGYILARFVYTIDGETLASLAVPPDPFVIDEAFRAIYAIEGFDFQRPERYDLSQLKTDIRAAINERFGEDLIYDVLVEQFDYIESNDVRGGGA